MKPEYSITIPIYNEEETLPELYRRLLTIMEILQGSTELILVDDGSDDRSLELMRELHQRDSRVRYLSLARNFGHQVAVSAGLHVAQGSSVIVMDADLQDPPEIIPRMVEKWRQGYQVVYAQRIARKQERWVKQVLAFVFYRVLRLLTDVDIPRDTGDFCLMDQQVVQVFNELPERSR